MSTIGTGLVGSYSKGELMAAPEAMQEVYTALTVLNGKDIYAEVKGAQFLTPFTREVFGGNGYVETHKELIVNGRKGGDGDYRNTVKRKEKAYKRTYFTEATTIGDVDFSMRMIEDAKKKGLNLSDLVAPKMESIARWYTRRYLAYSPYISLFEVPTDGGDFWSENGMVLNTVVPEYYVEPGKSTTRNHWMAIKESVGVSGDDILEGRNKLSEYVDVYPSDVVIYASNTTLGKVFSIYNEPANKDEFFRTGEPMWSVGGCRFIENDMIPEDFLLFVNANAEWLLTKNMEENAAFRGMDAYKENAAIKIDDEEDLVGMKFKIHPESWSMDGRTDALIMDINAERYNVNREMQADGFTAILNYVASLEARIDYTLRR